MEEFLAQVVDFVGLLNVGFWILDGKKLDGVPWNGDVEEDFG